MAGFDEQLRMLVNRASKNRRKLRSWRKKQGVTCFRMYDRDIPEIPLAVDWYEGRLNVSEYRVQREFEEGWAGRMAAGLGEALEVPPEHVHVKTRARQRGRDQYERLGQEGRRFEVSEGGHRFWVNLSDYLDTGLFLDHRRTRARVQQQAQGRDVLNLFCYTGSFSVYAAAGGARTTTSVDMSKTYLQWTEDNLKLNGFDGRGHHVVRADALAWLEENSRPAFDLAIVDPPTFSNSTRMNDSFDVLRDHLWLIERSVSLLRPGGICYFSTNARRFKLDPRLTEGALRAVDITPETLSPDYRNTRVHRCYRIVKPRPNW